MSFTALSTFTFNTYYILVSIFLIILLTLTNTLNSRLLLVTEYFYTVVLLLK